MTYLILTFTHVIGAIVILGTGTGIAFFMLMAHRSKDVHFIAKTASVVVLADMIFTASAVIAQPITGYLLMRETGTGLSERWLLVSVCLYIVAGLFWLPVVWIQIRLRDLARQAEAANDSLPAQYFRLFRIWFAFGIPGFGAVISIVWLMVAKPSLGTS